MYNLTERQIKDIAEQLELGFEAYFHKTKDEILIVPDTLRYVDLDTSAWDDELEKLEENFMDYVKIEAIEPERDFESWQTLRRKSLK